MEKIETKIIIVDTVIFERPNHEIGLEWHERKSSFVPEHLIQQVVPKVAGTKFMSEEALAEMREQKIPACADVVVTTILSNGEAAVLATMRSNPNGGNFGSWWMQGGMLAAGQPIEPLLQKRLLAEGGIAADAFIFAGVYRTVSEVGKGVFCDTIQPCYFTHVPWSEAQKAKTDDDHSEKFWMTKNDLDALPEEQINWYPKRLFTLALATAPE